MAAIVRAAMAIGIDEVDAWRTAQRGVLRGIDRPLFDRGEGGRK